MKVRRKIKGFTLIELLIVLGIVAVMSAGMYMIYNNVMLAQRSTEEINNLNILKGGIDNLFASASASDYDGLTVGLLADSSIPTQNMRKSATEIVNAWAYPYDVQAVAGSSGVTFSNYSIKTTIPQQACEKVVGNLISTWSGVAVNSENENVKTRGLNDFKVTELVTNCKSNDEFIDVTVWANDSK